MSRDDPLARLLSAAAEGDQRAATALVEAMYADVARVCSHLSDGDRCEDLVQETFLRTFRGARAFRGESTARTWILRIASNTCADDIRRAQQARRLVRRVESTMRGGDDGRIELTHLLLSGLSDERREAFVLTQVVGLSYAEAAETCSVPVGTIRSRVARARRDLLGALRSDEADAGGDRRAWSEVG